MPPDVDITVINATSIRVSWLAPRPSPDYTISAYCIEYVSGGGVSISKRRVEAEELAVTLSPLTPGASYTISVYAVYADMTEGPTASEVVGLPQEGGVALSVVEQPWFYAVLAVGGVLLLFCVIILACCICYQLCCKSSSYKGTN